VSGFKAFPEKVEPFFKNTLTFSFCAKAEWTKKDKSIIDKNNRIGISLLVKIKSYHHLE
jgi:hypothetical protein